MSVQEKIIQRQRNGYQELPGQEKGNLTLRVFIVYFLLCFCFGSFCFYYGHVWGHPHSTNEVRPKLKLTQASLNSFPPGFLIGCASSAYQIEGAWNTDGKGENIWDHLVHMTPSIIKNNDTGDEACDSYHKYKEDVQLIKNIGFNHYRFSISWSRVLPTGYDNVISRRGLKYYHNLIDELLAKEIIPMVTLYHWDLPQPLQDIGGWANPLMADYFEKYARVMFEEYGSKVKWWITINEPRNVIRGYAQPEHIMAPMVDQPGEAEYLAVHTLLRAHAKAYRLYDRVFRSAHGGKISITLNANHFHPSTESWEDKLASIRASEFEVGIFAHPIFSQQGDYPRMVRERVDHNSNMEGRSSSRLPRFTEDEVKEIRGSFDFYGLNHYTTSLVSSGKEGLKPSLRRDSQTILSYDPAWPTGKSAWLKVVPWGMRLLLKHIKNKYDNPPIFITENGYSTDSGLYDIDRILYYQRYLEQMLLAIYEDDCNVIGYTAWSILDNFEWAYGYTERFGLVYVNFSDPVKTRTMKSAGYYFKDLIKDKKLPDIEQMYNISVKTFPNGDIKMN